MLKVAILSALLIVVQGASLDEIYGSYMPVMYYTATAYVPYCLRISLAKDQRDIQCTCDNQKNTTLVETTMLEVSTPGQPTHKINEPSSHEAVLVVNSVDEVNPALNVSCKCEDKDFPIKTVIRKVNKNYIIMYSLNHSNNIEENTAQLMAQTLPKASTLLEDVMHIDELKNRRGIMICSKESYDYYEAGH